MESEKVESEKLKVKNEKPDRMGEKTITKNKGEMKWEMVKLGDVLDYEQPTNYIVESDLYDDRFDIPVLTAGKSFILGYTNETEGVFKNLPVIIFDDFTTVSKYVDFPFKVKSSAMKILRAKEGVADTRFMFYLLQTLNLDCEQHKRYWISKFAPLQIPLPPLSVQKRIAEILDAADALRRKDRELLKKYDELAQAVFIDMFGDPVKNEVQLSEIIAEGKNKIRSGPFGSDLLHSEFVDKGVFVLGIDNVVNNKFEISRERFITEEKFKSLARYQVFPDDVLISVMATIGRTAVVPENIGKAINSKHLIAITPNKKLINSIYFSYLLSKSESIKKQIKKMSKGAIMDGLNLGIVKGLKFDLPPISQQVQFAQILQNIETQKEKLNKSESDTLFQTLLQKAFKGELV